MEEDSAQSKMCIPPFVRQLYATLCSMLLVLSCVAALTYSSILLPQLEEEKGNIEINPSTTSWIGSTPSISSPFGCLLGGWLVERFGRKRTLQICTVPLTIGWLVLGFANNILVMLLGRILTGLSIGIQMAGVSIYVGELASPKYRDFLSTFMSLFISAAIFVCHLLGTFYHWKTVAIICSLCSILCGITISFTPETPSWLVSKNRLDQATKSFSWYRGDGSKEKEELTLMIERKAKENLKDYSNLPKDTNLVENATLLSDKNNKQLPKQQEISANNYDFKQKILYLKLAFTSREFVIPFIIMVNFFTILQFSGNAAILSYSIHIIKEIVGDKVNSYTALLSIDAIRLISSAVASVLVKIFEKRILALIGVGVTFLSLVAIALQLFLTKQNIISDNLYWLMLVNLIILVVAMANGIVVITWSLLGELFPLRFRGVGASIGPMLTCVMSFICAKTAPYMFHSWGLDGAFVFYACIVFISFIFIFKLLPETKGKTLQQIEDHFAKHSAPRIHSNGIEV